MSLAEIEIKSGGRAWVRTRLSHERAIAKRAMFASILPAKSVRLLQAAQARGADASEITDDVEMAATISNMAKAQAETIRLCVHHWDNVHDPEGDPLNFPDDVEKLDDADFDALYVACERAIETGRADPNAGGAPLPSTPPAESTPTEPPSI